MKNTFICLAILLLNGTFLEISKAETRETGPFFSVMVTDKIEAELVLSKTNAVETAFENAAESNLIVEVVDSVLKVRMKPGNYRDAQLKVKINYTGELRSLEADGRASIWSQEDLYFEKALTLKLYNGGEMRFRLYCDSISATLSQGSILYLTGEAHSEQVKVSTGATFSGYEFRTVSAHVTASGGAKAKVSASGYLNASASSKGFIGYVGEPAKVDEKTSLMGEILKTSLEE
jgi:hypothetical protein